MVLYRGVLRIINRDKADHFRRGAYKRHDKHCFTKTAESVEKEEVWNFKKHFQRQNSILQHLPLLLKVKEIGLKVFPK